MSRRYKRKRRVRFTTEITRGQFIFLTGCLAVVMLVFFVGVSKEPELKDVMAEEDLTEITATYIPTHTEIVTDAPEPTEEPEREYYGDPNNYIYPYNLMSADWGVELYESGFKYYEIPEEYSREGGCFPEVVQAYLWCLCEQRDIDYYIVVALIERESSYFCTASGDGGASKGYMQIYEKWHKDRMEAEGAENLYIPYDNIRVGLNFLQDLSSRSNGDYHYILMSYNMGESRCKELNREGIYSSQYSREILQRAQEIEQELQEQ